MSVPISNDSLIVSEEELKLFFIVLLFIEIDENFIYHIDLKNCAEELFSSKVILNDFKLE